LEKETDEVVNDVKKRHDEMEKKERQKDLRLSSTAF